MENEIQWNTLSEEDQKKQLFLQQKELLDTFLGTHAITQEQYNTSLHNLAQKMGFESEVSL